ncbi:MAG: hypothetical protein V3V88_03470 [Dehalococcoidia bacterium]
MATAKELIRQSLLTVEAAGYSDVLADDDQRIVDGLESLNNLISSLNAEGLMIPSITKVSHTLVAGTNNYTIGTGADIDTTRPMSISSAFIRDSSSYDHHVDIKAIEEYARISAKTTQGRPDRLYYNPAYSLGKIYLYFTPDTAEDLHMDLIVPLAEISAVGDTLDLPREYKRMLIYNLAIDIAPQFDIEDMSIIVRIANESKRFVKRLNIQPVPLMRMDSALTGRGRRYNIDSDE